MKTKRSNLELSPFHAIIFGGNGDLALRKIYPALYHRYADGQIDFDFLVIPVIRKPIVREDFITRIRKFIENETNKNQIQKTLDAFCEKVTPIVIPTHEEQYYAELKTITSANPSFQNIFYFSTPSSAFGDISHQLKINGLAGTSSKVVLEKPLGDSLKSAIAINARINEAFQEHQIYRIDHYLGKETVQNLMVLRFANHLFENAWNAEHIDHVQITVAESLGVESRAGYYDKSGALLDMVQNHLLQLLCLVAMEPPQALDADTVRGEKLKVLNSLRPFTKKSADEDTVRGQYSRGKMGNKEVSSYLEDIQTYESNTETFAALKVWVDNWRWNGVPFYLRTGKRMAMRYSEIVINFKPVRHNIFSTKKSIPNNRLIIRLQPEERIQLVQMSKVPGPGGYRYKPISLKLDFVDSFKERFPEAYERLIIDVIRGNQTLFMSQKELEASWEWIESITSNWEVLKKKNQLYRAGSWGPGDNIMENGHTWINAYEHEHF